MKKICTIDIDGVLTDYPNCWINYVNSITNENFKSKQEIKNKLSSISYKLYKELYRHSEYKYSLLVKIQIKNLLKYLKNQKYTIYIVTDRPSYCLPNTKQWLNKNNINYNKLLSKKQLLNINKKIVFHIDDESQDYNFPCFNVNNKNWYNDLMKFLKRPFFTICIETFNRGKTIYDTLLSLNNQSFKDFNVVIVDNQSTDNTINEIKRFLPTANFRYIFKQNKEHIDGIGNWNKTIEYADGQYIGMLEGDDQFKEYHLENAYYKLKSSNIGTYHTGIIGLTDVYVNSKNHLKYISNLKPVSPPSQTIFIYGYKYDTKFLYAPEIDLYYRIASDGYDAYYNSDISVIRSKKSKHNLVKVFWNKYCDYFNFINKNTTIFSIIKILKKLSLEFGKYLIHLSEVKKYEKEN